MRHIQECGIYKNTQYTKKNAATLNELRRSLYV